MKLIIAEKPSVAKSIASALGATSRADGYFEGGGLIVSWCLGHLVCLMDAAGYDERFKKWRYDDLPIVPVPFRYVLAPGKEAAFENLRSLMDRPDVDTIVNACDAGREGELIFRLVYDMAGCTKPVERLWVSSMEDAAIREGFENLRPGAEYDALYQSALCRQKADWLVGINATRLFSVLYHRTLTVGRVQTPTLAMLVERDGKIMLFKKEKYHHVQVTLNGVQAVSEKIATLEDAQTVKSACRDAVCTSVQKEQKKEQPPKLYDLTTLQREANRLLGYTAKQTLDYAQSLYEKKLLTYPRTDSRYLTSDMAETASCVLHMAAKVPPFDGCHDFFPLVEALVSDKDVSDHHALIPTMALERADLHTLPVGERNLFLLVCCKLLCAAAEPYIYETVTATFDCGGHTFTAKGKRVIDQGWREIDLLFRSFLKEKQEDDGYTVLPDFTEGQTFADVTATITEHFTSPPKPYTEDTLLAAMERAGAEDMPEDKRVPTKSNDFVGGGGATEFVTTQRKGLGTPATRAAIIEKLVASGFVARKGKNLCATKDGINLVTVLPEPLTSPTLTAEWEQQLSEIAKGSIRPEGFLQGIQTTMEQLVHTYTTALEEGTKRFTPDREPIGKCPRCGQPVYMGKRNFYCGDRTCGFVLWKDNRFWATKKVSLTQKIVAELLQKGRIHVKGMYSEKKNKLYDADVILEDTGGKYINFKLEFPQKGVASE
jgi:DNA topoisomerase-3